MAVDNKFRFGGGAGGGQHVGRVVGLHHLVGGRLAGARVLLTADRTYRKGRDVDLLGIAREALADPESPVERVVVLGRGETASALSATNPRARASAIRLSV